MTTTMMTHLLDDFAWLAGLRSSLGQDTDFFQHFEDTPSESGSRTEEAYSRLLQDESHGHLALDISRVSSMTFEPIEGSQVFSNSAQVGNGHQQSRAPRLCFLFLFGKKKQGQCIYIYVCVRGFRPSGNRLRNVP